MILGFARSSSHRPHSNKESNEFTNEDCDNEFDEDINEDDIKLMKKTLILLFILVLKIFCLGFVS